MRAIAVGVMMSIAAGGAASAAAKPKIPPLQVARPAPANLKARPVELSKLATDLKGSDRIGQIQYSPLCLRSPLIPDLLWSDVKLTSKEFASEFYTVMSKTGFPVEGDPSDMFATRNSGAAEYEIAAVIKTARGDACSPTSDVYRYRAFAFVDVEWQVYSRLKRQVVAKVQTTGSTDVTQIGADSMPKAIVGAFGDNVRALINDEGYRAVVLAEGGPASAPPPTTNADRSPIDLGKLSAKPSGLQDVVGSVVTVLAGGGHGSGFLVSDQGYIITNQHVTAGARTVRLRWSDNFETTGEVVREDKGRDVTLIKTDGRGRIPLALKRGSVPIGTEVYAIGAPIDEKLQGTVTRGIVSTSNRIFEGYAFLQSDVTVNPGNSGGPLVSKEGDVVAITDLGLRPDGVPTGINLFIPAGDALDFLGLKAAP